MLKDVQSGERSGLFAICNCSVSLATDPWSNGSAKLELAIYYGEPNRISRLKISGGVTLDLGSELVQGAWTFLGYILGREHRAVLEQGWLPRG